MIDVSSKRDSYREASAKGSLKVHSTTIARIREGTIVKGDPLPAAQIAAIMAIKQTSSILPLCHPLPITGSQVNLTITDDTTISAEVTVRYTGKTGVEMEALFGVSVALLTIWDMVKQYEKDVTGQYPHTKIHNVYVTQKEKTPLTPHSR